MSHAITKFNKRMRHKMREVEDRLEALRSVTETQVSHADKAIRAHVETLETGAQKTKQGLDQARTDMAAWIEDAKENVADWKAKLDTKMLQGRADRLEHYAEATLVVALAGVDDAEKAMLSASLARSEARENHK